MSTSVTVATRPPSASADDVFFSLIPSSKDFTSLPDKACPLPLFSTSVLLPLS
ncbi:MAG: hypothetical protein ACO21V_12095 [Limnohabitans sp.]